VASLVIVTFLPTYYYDQFGVTKVQAGQLTMLAAFMGAAVRVAGGWISDHWGGVNTLTLVLVVVAFALVGAGMASGSLVMTTMLLMVCFAALGAGNGALFQLVPLRWPMSTAVAGSMIGEIGALGGGTIPALMGQAKQHTGSFLPGFVVMAVFSIMMLALMRKMQVRWTRTWAEKGGPRTSDLPSRCSVYAGHVSSVAKRAVVHAVRDSQAERKNAKRSFRPFSAAASHRQVKRTCETTREAGR
jgi:NNP family nitrate/nitrite transporter-like MFS transporter